MLCPPYVLESCHAHVYDIENLSLSHRFQHFLSGQRRLRRKECFLRRLLRERLGTTPIEVNNFDKSKRRSLRSVLRVDVISVCLRPYVCACARACVCVPMCMCLRLPVCDCLRVCLCVCPQCRTHISLAAPERPICRSMRRHALGGGGGRWKHRTPLRNQ